MRFDVNPFKLNRELARELKEKKIVTAPEWAVFVKSGSHNERSPSDPEWFYHRAAAVLRAVAIKGPVGTNKLTVRFGGRKNRGVQPDKFQKASSNIIRKCLQQLEKGGLIHQVEHAGHKGRVLTKKGNDFVKNVLERTSKEVKA